MQPGHPPAASGCASAPSAPPPKRPSTAGQRLTQNLLTQCARWWNALPDPERLDWHRAGVQVRSRTRRKRSRRLDGQKLHHKLNTVLARCGLPRLTQPPPKPLFEPNPVIGLHLTGSGPTLALHLRLGQPPREPIMVFASPPCNPGRSTCRDFRFLGLLPPPADGLSDITPLYLGKFGPPPPNTRLFFRAWQMLEGWENRPGRWEGQALVPTPTPPPQAPQP